VNSAIKKAKKSGQMCTTQEKHQKTKHPKLTNVSKIIRKNIGKP
jgi:hypothetical protein